MSDTPNPTDTSVRTPDGKSIELRYAPRERDRRTVRATLHVEAARPSDKPSDQRCGMYDRRPHEEAMKRSMERLLKKAKEDDVARPDKPSDRAIVAAREWACGEAMETMTTEQYIISLAALLDRYAAEQTADLRQRNMDLERALERATREGEAKVKRLQEERDWWRNHARAFAKKSDALQKECDELNAEANGRM